VVDDFSKGRVLVAEDDTDLRDIIASFLDAKGWRVAALSTGPDAVLRAFLEPFTVVVLDVRSHASRGFITLRELRSRRPGLDVVVIASFGDTFIIRRARAMGAVEVLEKPFDLEELERAVSASSAG
jgi:DNA-binding NtrC family response regulator